MKMQKTHDNVVQHNAQAMAQAQGQEREDKVETKSQKVYPPGRPSDSGFALQGLGQPHALVVSGGCDKVVKVWDVKTG